MKRAKRRMVILAAVVSAGAAVAIWNIQAARTERVSAWLVEAVERDEYDAVVRALNEGADPDTEWRKQALPSSLIERLKRLFKSHTAEETMPVLCRCIVWRQGYSPNTAIAMELLRSGAHPNVRTTGYTIRTPLMLAVNTNNRDLVEELLKRGADIYARDEDARTPLFYAVSDARYVRMLLGRGALPNVRDRDGRTPLMYVRSIDVAKELVGGGADINAKDSSGESVPEVSMGLDWRGDEYRRELKTLGAR